jgi:hypothetical protein
VNPIGIPNAASWTAGGALPWGRPASPVAAAATGSPAGIAASYDQSYNNALAMNQANYSNILAGFQTAVAAQTSAQQAIQAGYSNLYNDVQARVEKIGAARSAEINDAAGRSLASGSQQLVDRGLGNTTVAGNLPRGVEADRNRRQLELSEAMAKMQGDYMSQLGLQTLGNAQGGADRLAGTNQRQLDWMNSLTAAYPDPGMYAGLAREAAQTQAAAGGDRDQWSYGSGVFAGAGGAGPKLGYVPAGGSYYGTGGYTPAAPTGGGGGSWLMGQYAAPMAAAATPGYGGGADWSGVGMAMADANQTAGYGMAPDWSAYGSAMGGAAAGAAGGLDYAALAEQAALAGAGY